MAMYVVCSGSIQLTGGLSIMPETHVQIGVQFNLTSASFIDFTTDVDFSDDVLMCLRMSRPDFHVRSVSGLVLLLANVCMNFNVFQLHVYAYKMI